MPTVNAGWILPCLLLIAPLVAAAETSSHIAREEICYTGEWASVDTYLARPATRALYEDPVQRERARERYEYWRENFDCRWITYLVDDLDIQGFVVKPAGKAPQGGWPVVIFNHGGNADIGQVRFQYIAARLFPLVDQGMVVIGSQYRGTKVGDEVNPQRLRDEFGGADVNDVRALVSIARALPGADATRIGMWGISRGGMMSLLAARGSADFDALVIEAAPTDLLKALEERPDMETVFRTWIPGYEDNREQALRERSALHWIDELDSQMPVLILHGAEDQRVSAMHSMQLAEALQQRQRPYKLVIYDGSGHGLRERHQEVAEEIVRWFGEKLNVKQQAH